ncbi:hypothetical protein AAVH_22776 [Aphelenchoides avenae]|nr:hypothetical protein AAVH_22776 [Aphelenchus avenae]
MPSCVAASGFRSLVSLNPTYFASHPNDIDIITHECMHLAQAYNWTSGIIPGWATEGIADYVRYTMGVDNGSAGWSLPEFKETQKLTDSYQVAARFFLWIEKNVKPGFVKAFDKALRSGSGAGFFKRVTGKTEDELWEQYAQNPKI